MKIPTFTDKNSQIINKTHLFINKFLFLDPYFIGLTYNHVF